MGRRTVQYKGYDIVPSPIEGWLLIHKDGAWVKSVNDTLIVAKDAVDELVTLEGEYETEQE